MSCSQTASSRPPNAVAAPTLRHRRDGAGRSRPRRCGVRLRSPSPRGETPALEPLGIGQRNLRQPTANDTIPRALEPDCERESLSRITLCSIRASFSRGRASRSGGRQQNWSMEQGTVRSPGSAEVPRHHGTTEAQTAGWRMPAMTDLLEDKFRLRCCPARSTVVDQAGCISATFPRSTARDRALTADGISWHHLYWRPVSVRGARITSMRPSSLRKTRDSSGARSAHRPSRSTSCPAGSPTHPTTHTSCASLVKAASSSGVRGSPLSVQNEIARNNGDNVLWQFVHLQQDGAWPARYLVACALLRTTSMLLGSPSLIERGRKAAIQCQRKR